MSPDPHKEAVKRNYDAFKEELPTLLREHRNKFALMRDGEVVGFFDSSRDAALVGNSRYDDGIYSVQKVTDQVEDLGYYSYAVG